MLKNLKNSQKIVYCALLAAVAVIVKFLSIKITPAITVSFFYLPCFISGIFLGPIYGLFTSFTGEIIGTVLQGNTIFPLTLIGNSLIGFMMGLVFNVTGIKNKYVRIVLGTLTVLVITTFGFNTLSLAIRYYDNDFLLSLSLRALQPIPLTVNCVLTIYVYEILKRTVFKKNLNEEQFKEVNATRFSSVLATFLGILLAAVTVIFTLLSFNGSERANIYTYAAIVSGSILAIYATIIVIRNYYKQNENVFDS